MDTEKDAGVVVHPHVDIDSVACIVLSGVSLERVHYVTAAAEELPELCACHGKSLQGARLLDHPLGEKGRIGKNGTRHAAVCSMPEAKTADPKLLAEVDEDDTKGFVKNPRFALSKIMVGLRLEAIARGLSGIALDQEVTETMVKLMRGLNLIHHQNVAGRAKASDFRIEKVGKLRFVVMRPGETIAGAAPSLYSKYNVSGYIYVQGNNLGVTRFSQCDAPDFRNLADHLPGWFVHTAGFMACWGSNKSPACKPPPDGTPQTPDELLELLRRVYV